MYCATEGTNVVLSILSVKIVGLKLQQAWYNQLQTARSRIKQQPTAESHSISGFSAEFCADFAEFARSAEVFHQSTAVTAVLRHCWPLARPPTAHRLHLFRPILSQTSVALLFPHCTAALQWPNTDQLLKRRSFHSCLQSPAAAARQETDTENTASQIFPPPAPQVLTS